ncbi:MAG: hypothetical protein AAF517_02275 [Planctomycetota bacterium]
MSETSRGSHGPSRERVTVSIALAIAIFAALFHFSTPDDHNDREANPQELKPGASTARPNKAPIPRRIEPIATATTSAQPTTEETPPSKREPSVIGVVLDRDGEPAPDIGVRIQGAGRLRSLMLRTDEEGQFRAKLVEGAQYSAWALSEDEAFPAAAMAGFFARRGELISLELADSHTLSVRTRSCLGTRVGFVSVDSRYVLSLDTSQNQQTLQINGLPAGRYESSYGTVRLPQTKPFEITCVKEALIHGMVTLNGETLRTTPCRYSKTSLKNGKLVGNGYYHFETDGNGRYEIEASRLSSQVMFSVENGDPVLPLVETIETSKEDVRLDLNFQRGVTVEWEFRGATGEALRRQPFRAESVDFPALFVHGRTDPEGVAEIHTLQPGEYSVSLRGGCDPKRVHQRVFVGNPVRSSAVLHFPVPPPLSILVRDHEDEPVPGAYVSVNRTTKNGSLSSWTLDPADASGEVLFGCMDSLSGRVRIQTSANGIQSRVSFEDFQMSEAARTRRVVLRLESYVRLRVSVTDQDGRPLASERVVFGQPERTIRAVTRIDGSAEAMLPPGEWKARLKSVGCDPIEEEFTVEETGNEPLELTLPFVKPQTIRGIVRDAPAATVVAEHDGEPVARATLQRRREFLLSVPPGRAYSLGVLVDGALKRNLATDVYPGEEITVLQVAPREPATKDEF